ncbi:hypothetical protein DQ244_06375 [Blastococcus sp. TBT05-19]|uniref:hypothetical protein n=1 Tax=Blastococcus sp. TBT05-19 TaxID=2250581 RepID=UPI000DEA5343|nr:hypothetical protein [Blastococcus sp. TBT05-19]RBY94874.1 hypothetical protein DQ244_06375 [Blastococcus sp. TBT05-19]
MLRRALPVGLAAAALALVPAGASAAPASAGDAANASTSISYYAHGSVTLPDGRSADVSLGEFRAVDGWTGSLNLYLSPPPCTGWPCMPTMESGYAELDADDVTFDRNLNRAAVEDVPVTLSSWSWGGGSTQREVTVDVVLTGTGRVDRDTYRGPCGEGSPGCKGVRVDAARDADVVLTIDGEDSTGTGRITRGFGVDIGAPTNGGGEG